MLTSDGVRYVEWPNKQPLACKNISESFCDRETAATNFEIKHSKVEIQRLNVVSTVLRTCVHKGMPHPFKSHLITHKIDDHENPNTYLTSLEFLTILPNSPVQNGIPHSEPKTTFNFKRQTTKPTSNGARKTFVKEAAPIHVNEIEANFGEVEQEVENVDRYNAMEEKMSAAVQIKHEEEAQSAPAPEETEKSQFYPQMGTMASKIYSGNRRSMDNGYLETIRKVTEQKVKNTGDAFDMPENGEQSMPSQRSKFGGRSSPRKSNRPAINKKPTDFDPYGLYVNKLPDKVEESELREIYEKFGEIKNINLRTASKRDDGKTPMSYAHIFYTTEEGATAALEAERPVIRGVPLNTQRKNASAPRNNNGPRNFRNNDERSDRLPRSDRPHRGGPRSEGNYRQQNGGPRSGNGSADKNREEVDVMGFE